MKFQNIFNLNGCGDGGTTFGKCTTKPCKFKNKDEIIDVLSSCLFDEDDAGFRKDKDEESQKKAFKELFENLNVPN